MGLNVVHGKVLVSLGAHVARVHAVPPQRGRGAGVRHVGRQAGQEGQSLRNGALVGKYH